VRALFASASIAIACGGSPRSDTGTTPAAGPVAMEDPAPHEDPAPASYDAPATEAAAPEPRTNPLDAEYRDARAGRVLRGQASYYHDSLAGNPTASGEPYDPRAFTAANRTLPFGTVLRVTREDTGATVLVRVNDRGPFGRRRRVVDLSRAAAESLDMIRAGVVTIRAEVLTR
jgi:rare lipoprotein A